MWLIMKISNPIFKELLKLKLINRRNLVKISNQTRDKTIPVYKRILADLLTTSRPSSSSSSSGSGWNTTKGKGKSKKNVDKKK